jgi:hypothetical protein
MRKRRISKQKRDERRSKRDGEKTCVSAKDSWTISWNSIPASFHKCNLKRKINTLHLQTAIITPVSASIWNDN